MKITLCVFLSITAGSVYGQVKQLHERVGQSVEFPTEVKNSGNVMYLSKVIALVTSSARQPLSNEYDSRLQWDSSTGLFSLSGLKMEDKGEYKVVKNDGTQSVQEKYQLMVYDGDVPVSKPRLTVASACKLMCTVERGTRVTLSWHKEGEKEDYGSVSGPRAQDLNVSLSVKSSGTYTCKVYNSVSSNSSDPHTVKDNCTGGAAGSWQTEGCRVWSLALGLVVMLHSLLV